MKLTLKQQTDIKQLVMRHGGMLPVGSLQSLLSELDETIDEFMMAVLGLAGEFAVVPVSRYQAAVVALGETGNLYVGANQEYAQTGICQTVHAEQAAVAIAHQHGETGLVKMAINANPCGHCRQFLFELVDGGRLEILVSGAAPTTIAKLLPHAFGPGDLKVQGGLLSSQQHALQLMGNANDDLLLKACEVALKSYAPYTKAYAAVVLRTQGGVLFAGAYLENAAFNPSLPAMQSALVSLAVSGRSVDEVVAAALVQVKDNVVDHEAAARLVLKALCPTVVLQVGELVDKSL
tara:strand:+ start:2273 stop:3148 length:876 start_codon:yes stop_codon:yes gene_type:complete